jgi:hypothetical protein
MKKTLSILAIFTILIATNQESKAQNEDSYSLITEKYTQRPLTLHRGQFQIYTGYELSVLNKDFTESGDINNLAEDGRAAVMHKIPLLLEFGVLEYLQISAGINYAKSGLRSRNRTIFGYDSFLDIYELTEIKGTDHLSLGLDLRLPTGIDWLDISFSGGLNIPISDSEPEQPEHSYFEANGLAMLNYHFFEKYSSGIKSSRADANIKYRSPDFSIQASYSFSSAMEDGENIYWDSYLNLGEFTYSSEDYQYNTGQISYWEAIATYQAINWFNAQLFINSTQSKNGWSTQSGLKLGDPDRSVINGGIGYEIQVMPNLRLSQHLQIPLAGKNYTASLSFLTGISFNFLSEGYHNIF